MIVHKLVMIVIHKWINVQSIVGEACSTEGRGTSVHTEAAHRLRYNTNIKNIRSCKKRKTLKKLGLPKFTFSHLA